MRNKEYNLVKARFELDEAELANLADFEIPSSIVENIQGRKLKA